MLLTGTPLSPPTGLTATALDDNTVSLIWSPAADVPDETGINYEVQRQTPSGWSNVAIVDPTLDGDAAFDTAVAGATTLNYQVRAVDLIDATLNSAYAAFAPVTTPLTQPDAPDNLSATSTTPGQVDLSWDEASPIVTVYAVTATPAYGGTPVTRLAPAYVSAYNFNGLTPDQPYTFSVIAINDQGDGHAVGSDPSYDLWAFAPPVALAATAPATVGEGDPVPLALASTPPGGGSSPVTSWTVAWADGGRDDFLDGADPTLAHVPRAAGTSAVVTAQEADYEDGGPSFVLPPVYVDVVPLAPSAVHAVVGSSTQVNLDWANNSRVATAVRVLRADAGSTDYQVVADLPANATTFSDADLTPDTRYDYQISSLGGQYSTTESVAVAPASPVTTPDVPRVTLTPVTVVPNGDGATRQIDFGWAYAGTGDEAAVGYEVEGRQLTGRWPAENYSLWLTAAAGPGGTYSFGGERDQPFEGEQFQFRVRADLANGTATDYAQTAPVTAAAIAPELHADDDPTGIAGTLLTWSYVGAVNPSGFEVQARRDDSPFWTLVSQREGDVRSQLTGQYPPGLKYHYRVRALSHPPDSGLTNPSVWSAEVEHVIPGRTDVPPDSEDYGLLDRLQHPTVRYEQVDDHTVRLHWGDVGTYTDYYGNVVPNNVDIAVYEIRRDPTRPLEMRPYEDPAWRGGYPAGQTSDEFPVTPGKEFVALVRVGGPPSYPAEWPPYGPKRILDEGVTGMAWERGIVGKAATSVAKPFQITATRDPHDANFADVYWTNSSNNEDDFSLQWSQDGYSTWTDVPNIDPQKDETNVKIDISHLNPGAVEFRVTAASTTKPTTLPATSPATDSNKIPIARILLIAGHQQANGPMSVLGSAGVSQIHDLLIGDHGGFSEAEVLSPLPSDANADGRKSLKDVETQLIKIGADAHGEHVDVGLVGYSLGGGLIYDVLNDMIVTGTLLQLPKNITILATVYIDAIDFGDGHFDWVQWKNALGNGLGPQAQGKRPPGSADHYCFYQSKLDMAKQAFALAKGRADFWEVWPHGTASVGPGTTHNKDLDANANVSTHLKIDKDLRLHKEIVADLRADFNR